MEELRLLPLEPKRGCVELFVRAYDDDSIPPELETIIRLYGSIERTDLDEQTKGTIWLDDRTSIAYPPASSALSPGQRPYHHGATPPLDPHTPDSYCHSEIDDNPAAGTNPGVPEDASTESASARYSPTSRRPNVPLTAKMLYTLLREEVILVRSFRNFWLPYAGIRTCRKAMFSLCHQLWQFSISLVSRKKSQFIALINMLLTPEVP